MNKIFLIFILVFYGCNSEPKKSNEKFIAKNLINKFYIIIDNSIIESKFEIVPIIKSIPNGDQILFGLLKFKDLESKNLYCENNDKNCKTSECSFPYKRNWFPEKVSHLIKKGDNWFYIENTKVLNYEKVVGGNKEIRYVDLGGLEIFVMYFIG